MFHSFCFCETNLDPRAVYQLLNFSSLLHVTNYLLHNLSHWCFSAYCYLFHQRCFVTSFRVKTHHLPTPLHRSAAATVPEPSAAAAVLALLCWACCHRIPSRRLLRRGLYLVAAAQQASERKCQTRFYSFFFIRDAKPGTQTALLLVEALLPLPLLYCCCCCTISGIRTFSASRLLLLKKKGEPFFFRHCWCMQSAALLCYAGSGELTFMFVTFMFVQCSGSLLPALLFRHCLCSGCCAALPCSAASALCVRCAARLRCSNIVNALFRHVTRAPILLSL